MTTSSGTSSGGLSVEDRDFLLTRSEGFGAVILGSHSVSPTGHAFSRGWNIYAPENHPALVSFVEALHRQRTKAILQLYHAGRLAQPAFIQGKQPVSPSRIPAKRSFASFPREMALREIEEVFQAFQAATSIAIELGFDGIELHGANTYLLQQFYSPHSNRRTDQWGGSQEKRMRFVLETIQRCQAVIEKEAEKPFILGYRFSPEEYEIPGIRLTDTCELLKNITDLPLDYVHISLSDYRKRSQEGEEIIGKLKQYASSIPLIGCGNIQSKEDIHNVLQHVPLLSVGNAAVLDPDWAKKVIHGREDIKTTIHISEREKLKIPFPLWESMVCTPFRYFGK